MPRLLARMARRSMRRGRSPTAASSAGRACSPGIASMRRPRCWPRTCRPISRGAAADLGAGYGYLAAEVLARCPGITALDLYEAEARALDLARSNLAAVATRVALGFHWHDVTTGLPQALRRHRQQSAVPRAGPRRSSRHRPALHRRRRRRRCKPGGRLWLVANRHLPYEAVLDDALRQRAHGRAAARLQGDRSASSRCTSTPAQAIERWHS